MNTVPFPVDNDKIERSFPAVRVHQPIGDIFLGSISPDLLQHITSLDVRRVMRDERDIERYLGIQRPLNEKRVDQLKRYVNYTDATFPTFLAEPDTAVARNRQMGFISFGQIGVPNALGHG